MLHRLIFAVGFLSITFGVTADVSAEWFWGFFNHIARETKRRQCWPAPFVAPDRSDARTPFCITVNNGWRRQNMLSRFHFQPQTGQLTEAGRNKVRWIAEICPAQHRLVYVHTADAEEETRARHDAVERLIAQISPDNPLPVLSTSISEEGWSAEQADIIERKYRSSTPSPRLPKESTQDSGGESSY